MKVLIAYDIADPKRLRKVAKFLLGYGNRLQYSVFELDINVIQLQDIQKHLDFLIDKKYDRVTYIHLCAQCAVKMKTIGVKLTSDFIEAEHTLIVS